MNDSLGLHLLTLTLSETSALEVGKYIRENISPSLIFENGYRFNALVNNEEFFSGIIYNDYSVVGGIYWGTIQSRSGEAYKYTSVGGADSVLPFNSSNYIYLVKDGIVQDNTGINFNVESLVTKGGYLQPSSSVVATGRITLPSLDLSKYKSIVVDMSRHDKSGIAIYWYIGGTNADYGSRQNFADNGYTGIKDVACACGNASCRLYNLFLVPI